MSDENQEINGKKGGIGAILNLVLKILIGLVLTTTVLTNLFLIYIVVAPDTLPKPFYLQYKGDSTTTTNEGQPTESDVHAENPMEMPAEIHVMEPGEGIFIDTGTKIVNLADEGGRKFIRVNVVVEFAPDNLEYMSLAEEAKAEYLNEFNTEITNRLPVINDIIITQISTKDFQSIYTAEGKEILRAEMIAILDEKLAEFTILNVYFTEFVMQ
ncbi:MAG: flagellar basal body-associated FliL family protein [Anaerolineaceae bacterium]|nr:flagellar basal body-associated FliL family protein [Anaerolineaceae bacterium]